MRKLICVLALLLPGMALAAGGNVHLDKANYDLSDKASLQRGAKLFMNYCLGCHGQQYQRYQRTFNDLGIPEELAEENLQFTGEKISDYIERSMPAESAAQWFAMLTSTLTKLGFTQGVADPCYFSRTVEGGYELRLCVHVDDICICFASGSKTCAFR